MKPKSKSSDSVEKSRSIVFGAWHYWNIAADCAQRAREVKKAKPAACTADTIPAVIMSAVAAEAFINELSVHIVERLRGCSTDIIAIGKLLKALEAEHATVTVKYVLLSHLLPGKPFESGEAPFQDFNLLIRLRNRFVHPIAQEKAPTFMEGFRIKGWTYDSMDRDDSLMGWVFQMETPAIAVWACRTVYDLIWSIIMRWEGLPDPVRTLLAGVASQWSEAKTDPRTSNEDKAAQGDNECMYRRNKSR